MGWKCLFLSPHSRGDLDITQTTCLCLLSARLGRMNITICNHRQRVVSWTLLRTGFIISYCMSVLSSKAAQQEQICRVAQLEMGTPVRPVCVSGVLLWMKSGLLLSTQQPSAMEVLRALSWWAPCSSPGIHLSTLGCKPKCSKWGQAGESLSSALLVQKILLG